MYHILSYLANIGALPSLYFKVMRSLKFQRNYLQQNLMPETEAFRKSMDETLGADDFKKIFKYYGLAVPAILGTAFSELRGYPMSDKERHTLTYLGALTGLFDDFSDKLQTPKNHVRDLFNKGDERDAENSHELLFVRFVNQAMKYILQPDVFLSYANKVFEMQEASTLQKQPNISRQQLKEITFGKGGYSLLFYRSAMDDFSASHEKDMVFRLGSLMQLENDLFDVYKDRENDIHTLVTKSTSIKPLKNIYEKMLQETFELVEQSGFKPRNQKEFLRYISIVLNRGMVCLNQLKQLEQNNDGEFNVHDYTRKALICDMEKPLNILRMIHYYARCSVRRKIGR